MQRKFVLRSALLALMLLVTSCGTSVSVVPRECLFDFMILPSDTDIDTMSDDLAMQLAEHNELHINNCEGEAE